MDWKDLAFLKNDNVPKSSDWTEWQLANNEAFRYYRLMVHEGHAGGKFFLSISDLELSAWSDERIAAQ